MVSKRKAEPAPSVSNAKAKTSVKPKPVAQGSCQGEPASQHSSSKPAAPEPAARPEAKPETMPEAKPQAPATTAPASNAGTTGLVNQAEVMKALPRAPTWEIYEHVLKPLVAEELAHLQTLTAVDTGGFKALTNDMVRSAMEQAGFCTGLVTFAQLGLAQSSVFLSCKGFVKPICQPFTINFGWPRLWSTLICRHVLDPSSAATSISSLRPVPSKLSQRQSLGLQRLA